MTGPRTDAASFADWMGQEASSPPQVGQAARQFVQAALTTIADAMSTGQTDSLEGDLEGLIADFLDVADAPAEMAKGAVTGRITKKDSKNQIVYGWASVATKGGEVVKDLQGDMVDMADLTKAAHDYVRTSRRGDTMHKTKGTGEVVESVVFDKALQAALGIDLGMEGWFIGMHVPDTDVWKRVESGELAMFSIGGTGVREQAT